MRESGKEWKRKINPDRNRAVPESGEEWRRKINPDRKKQGTDRASGRAGCLSYRNLSGGYEADGRFSCDNAGLQFIHTWLCAIADLIQQDFHGLFTNLIQRLRQGSEFRADFFGQQGIVKAGNGNVLWNRIRSEERRVGKECL